MQVPALGHIIHTEGYENVRMQEATFCTHSNLLPYHDCKSLNRYVKAFRTSKANHIADLDQTSNWFSRGSSIAWQIDTAMHERKCLLHYT